MTNYEFFEDRKEKAAELLRGTKDFHLKEFYRNAIEGYNIIQGGMTLEDAEQKFRMR